MNTAWKYYKGGVGLAGIAGGAYGCVTAYKNPEINTREKIINEVLSYSMTGALLATPLIPVCCVVNFAKFGIDTDKSVPNLPEGSIEGHPYPED